MRLLSLLFSGVVTLWWVNIACAAETRFIEVRATKLRAEPKFWAAPRGDIAYGDAVTVIGTEGDWLRVQLQSGIEGYLHGSATTARRVVIEGKAQPAEQSSDVADVVLAGKGFAGEIADTFETSDLEADYQALIIVERRTVSYAELQTFLKEGGLVSDG